LTSFTVILDKLLSALPFLSNIMNRAPGRFSVITLLSLVVFMIVIHYSPTVHANPASPVVGIWSGTYSSSVISDPFLSVGTTVTVDVNASSAPAFNGYDFTLFFDPNYLKPVFVDVIRGTAFPNPFVGVRDLATPGRVRLAVVNLGSAFPGGSATLAHISFNVTGTGVSPLSLGAGTTHPSVWAQTWTELVLGTSVIDVTTADGYFSNLLGNPGPIASFTLSPTLPIEGSSIIFDASSSFDQDNNNGVNKGLREYLWDFGDGTSDFTIYPAVIHSFSQILGFNLYGNFSVRLTVVDSDQHFEGMMTKRVLVAQTLPPATTLVVQTNPIPRTVSPGVSVTYAITIIDGVGLKGPVSLKASVVPSLQNGPTASMPAKVNLHGPGSMTVTVNLQTTTNTPPGNYAVVITGSRLQLSDYAIIFLTVSPS